MRAPIRVVIAASVVCLAGQSAQALPALTSPPLKGGAGGLVCSCSNLSPEAIEVNFRLAFESGSSSCSSQVISSRFLRSCQVSSQVPRICEVTRVDGKASSIKQLVCTLSSLDANGNVTAVVPVDRKVK